MIVGWVSGNELLFYFIGRTEKSVMNSNTQQPRQRRPLSPFDKNRTVSPVSGPCHSSFRPCPPQQGSKKEEKAKKGANRALSCGTSLDSATLAPLYPLPIAGGPFGLTGGARDRVF